MPSQDQEILATTINKLGAEPKEAEFDAEGHLVKLDLSDLGLVELPPEIGQLIYLKILNLDGNQLSMLPDELWQLQNLRTLWLGKAELMPGELIKRNNFNHLPIEIVQLTQLQELSLAHIQLTQLPPNFDHLINLQKLWLNDNQFQEVSSDLARLTNLQHLDLSGNNLKMLPHDFACLTNLRYLDLSYNKLKMLPPDFACLTNLQYLGLSGNKLEELPSDFARLTNLQHLDLSENKLKMLPPDFARLTNLQYLGLSGNKLKMLPPDFARLTNLQYLGLSGNKLEELPPDFARLTNLQHLGLSGNKVRKLPPDFAQLVKLDRLWLRDNQLLELPYNFDQLTNLYDLKLTNNQLKGLPPSIGHLYNLLILELDNNQLADLPLDFGHLTNLYSLSVASNHLYELPISFGHLTNLKQLSLDGNNWRTPPPEIIERGTQEILAFMRDLQEGAVIRYEAKLLLVGEGRAGKTSLLRALRDEAFNSNLESTHGIDIKFYNLPHPDRRDKEITLNIWDFGGQQIYQTTHQFFLTKRSVYLVVWNAGVDTDQGRLDHWLKTIQTLAPDSPVLLVATHLDQRQPDFNYQSFKEAYPQLVEYFGVSNKTGQGIEELKAALAKYAAQLPLMDQQWPQKWVAAEQALLSRPEHHLHLEDYGECCFNVGVNEEIARTVFGGYLHDLGKILYFQDDPLLKSLIILKPNWITKAVSRVLIDEATRTANGILSHADLPGIWAADDDGRPYDSHLYPIFLRLMERFDLSYQIEPDMPGEPTTHSLIPQLLPFQPPENLPPWPEKPLQDQTQVEMVYRFDFVPAGIMPWFIVRTHRYTTAQHWREGCILTYEDHHARVELNPMLRELRLLVWGVLPQNFFTILKNTIDLILARFEGLRVQREVPCICHWQRDTDEPCPRFYHYEDLVRRMEKNRLNVECEESFERVYVPTLLYGIHPSTDQQVIAALQENRKLLQELKQGQMEILAKNSQMAELLNRNFTRQWNLEMKKIEAECPGTFILMPGSGTRFNPKNWISQEYHLYLVCQHPPGPHSVGKGYSLRQAEEWWIQISPWLGYLLKFLKYGVPMNKVTGLGEAAGLTEDALKQFEEGIKVLEQINSDLPKLAKDTSLKQANIRPDLGEEQEFVGPALRALHSFLKEVDKKEDWGGLHKTITPDGNILWLCGEHRQPYVVEPLVLIS